MVALWPPCGCIVNVGPRVRGAWALSARRGRVLMCSASASMGERSGKWKCEARAGRAKAAAYLARWGDGDACSCDGSYCAREALRCTLPVVVVRSSR